MADHRRVEDRNIIGSGMATDPERVQHLEEEAARKERAWRERGEVGFGDVLKTAPARASTEDEGGEPAAAEEPPAEAAVEPPAAGAAQPDAPAPAKKLAAAADRKTRTSGLPPDPRMRSLHRLLESGASRIGPRAPQQILPNTGETPPTGTVKGKKEPL